MATTLQVTCINKTDRYSAHERIENIGGMNWKHSEDDAISYIENDVYLTMSIGAGIRQT